MPIANEMLTRTEGDPIEPSDEPESLADDPMARVRPGEAAGELLAQARVLGALFGQQSAAVAFGRFQVLKRLGAGGMGVVYEAYDPDLARGVALKLVNVAVKDRETALAEAKALARLSHPNVVPIYDVGLERDHVFLVMELVRGKTLGQWSEGRTLRELLSVYQQAGAALAAAHDVGLVHRDFKPDNAIVGDDGRVRVVDFGLACEADAPVDTTIQRRGAAGTPRFMAPEIKAGTAITPAADQYSFSVALAAALALARQSPPRRMAAVIERGRAADPAARFASMRELLRALARDPARTLRRVAAAGAAVTAVVASAFFVGQNHVDACERGADQLETAWSRSARSAALDRIAALGSYGQLLRPQLEHDLDTHASHWVGESRAACLDRRRGTESATQLDRRRACLQRGSDAFATVGELISQAEPADLAQLLVAVQSMPDPASCSDADVIEPQIAPPFDKLAPVQRQITNARILVSAGRYEQAVAGARKAVAEARALGHGPVLAEALFVQGRAQVQLDREAAVPILAEATQVALSSHADALAVESWAWRAVAQPTRADPDGVIAGLDVIEPIARRTASATHARATLYNILGNIEIRSDQRAKAREYFARGLTESQKLTGEAALDLLPARTNLALVSEDRAGADQRLVELDAELTHQIGADHPETLNIRWLRGSVTIEDLQQAERVLAPVCDAYELHVALAARRARCWTEVGLLRMDLGDGAGAIAAMTRAMPASSNAQEAAAYISLWTGNPQAAVQQFTDAIAAAAPESNENLRQRVPRAQLTLGLGRARREMNDLRGAREALERTIADLEPVVNEHAEMSYQRRLGRARVELAFTLSSLGVRAPERVDVAKAAAGWLRRAGGSPVELAKLEDLARE